MVGTTFKLQDTNFVLELVGGNWAVTIIDKIKKTLHILNPIEDDNTDFKTLFLDNLKFLKSMKSFKEQPLTVNKTKNHLDSGIYVYDYRYSTSTHKLYPIIQQYRPKVLVAL